MCRGQKGPCAHREALEKAGTLNTLLISPKGEDIWLFSQNVGGKCSWQPGNPWPPVEPGSVHIIQNTIFVNPRLFPTKIWSTASRPKNSCLEEMSLVFYNSLTDFYVISGPGPILTPTGIMFTLVVLHGPYFEYCF